MSQCNEGLDGEHSGESKSGTDGGFGPVSVSSMDNRLALTFGWPQVYRCAHCGAVTGNLWGPTGTTTITWPAADAGQAEAEAA